VFSRSEKRRVPWTSNVSDHAEQSVPNCFFQTACRRKNGTYKMFLLERQPQENCSFFFLLWKLGTEVSLHNLSFSYKLCIVQRGNVSLGELSFGKKICSFLYLNKEAQGAQKSHMILSNTCKAKDCRLLTTVVLFITFCRVCRWPKIHTLFHLNFKYNNFTILPFKEFHPTWNRRHTRTFSSWRSCYGGSPGGKKYTRLWNDVTSFLFILA
jgi:hypothetical protein